MTSLQSGVGPVRQLAPGSNLHPQRDWVPLLEGIPPSWRMVPLDGQKRPVNPITGTPQTGWTECGQTVAEICALKSPNIRAIGVLLGPASGGLLAVDFDGPEAAAKFESVFAQSSSDLPPTVAVTSGRPGRCQKLFLVPESKWAQLGGPKSWKGADGKTCLELRWTGQQSAIAGDHPSTDGYRWMPGQAPADLEPAPAPPWLLAALLRQPIAHLPPVAHSKTDSERAIEMLACLPQGDFQSYDEWLKVGMALHHTDRGLLAAWVDWCRPMVGFDEGECLTKWESFDKGHSGSNVTIASLHKWAAGYGYQEPRRAPTPAQGTGLQQPSPRGSQERTWSQLIGAMLDATISGEDDLMMALLAETIGRFKRSESQIKGAIFKLHTERETQGKGKSAPESLDMSQVTGMDWLVEGFIPDNDLTLIFGDAGSGKTTAALSTAVAVLLGTGLLDHTQPSPRRGVLFIASDSGAAPLRGAMQEMGIADLPMVQEGAEKRFHVWAADAGQGMTSWAADLRGCIRLLEFIKRHQIGLVLIDSCKAVCSAAGLDYTDNTVVTALLTYFKEVICPHAAVVWLNHDGVAKGAHAGAKAWREVPSIVHRISKEESKDGSFVQNRRWWEVKKNRLGKCRKFAYELREGDLTVAMGEERVGNCLAQVVDVLTSAWQQGIESLSRADLVEGICLRGGPSIKTVDNTLSNATHAKHPEICRVNGKRGHYKLAPRMVGALRGCIVNGKEQDQTSLYDRVLVSSRQVPVGTSQGKHEFPKEIIGKSSNASADKASGPITSQHASTPNRKRVLLEFVSGSHWDAGAVDDDPAWGLRETVPADW